MLERTTVTKIITFGVSGLVAIWGVVVIGHDGYRFVADTVLAATTTAKYAGTATDGGGTYTWTNPSNATGDTTGTAATVTPASKATSNNLILTNFGFTSTDVPAGSQIDGVTVEVEWQGSGTKIVDNLAQLTKDGTAGVGDNKALGTSQTTKQFRTYGGAADTWNATLTQTDVTSTNFGVILNYYKNAGGSAVSSVFRVRITINYTTPTFEQSAYRIFNNANSTDVGTALATQDTAVTLANNGDAFRLRQLIHIGATQLPQSAVSFKLQFAQKSGTCDTAFSGETYADVTAATAIAYYDNATPADGATLTGNANDPVHSGHTTVNQTYEELNNFTNSVAAIPSGQDGMWDFALVDNVAGAVTYCFRVVKSDGSLLGTYTVIPEVTTSTAGGALTVDIVDAAGTPVGSPSVVFSSLNVGFTHQTTNGTFGVSTQRVRVTNTTATPQWTVSLAAGGGSTDFWDGVSWDFDFNDPTANAVDGADADSYGGQMTIDPSVGTVTPQSGCNNTGITLGSSTGYSEGVTDSITLFNAGVTAQTGCYWDLTGVGVSQTVPNEQPSDSYDINMVLSIVAS